ncbi:nucleotidyltransferase domain-containing protein [Rhodomicrobium vannielii ATCC 17100]|uniref:GSU2403 family nucleotidyltransferase fold protein n=1 Tax=Rhodomicrobium vannielii TaxID=1069 RepID=UPI001918D0A2|nr:nucleotidyltransferase domain-containing protein [Rhodomicrobium vannielii]MBJ7532944.1 nucleotidyltransferase domain-containing protein [Rhodomicrobium vannielii ATCC 17100]
MDFAELSNEQRRQLIDVKQAFEVWRSAQRQFASSYKGTVRWKKSKGHEYLYRTIYRGEQEISRSLGPRSPETEKIKDDYSNARARLRQRLNKLQSRLKGMAPVNRALRLNRVPAIETSILSALDREGLLGKQLFVVGTNALFAYELMAGVLFPSDLLATGDMDLLWDHRPRLSLVITDVEAHGVLGVLRGVDSSFQPAGRGSFRAENNQGYLVDLIRAEERDLRVNAPQKIGRSEEDLYAVGIHGLQWLVNAPKVEETVIGSTGMPLLMSCIDPRAFALHKLWVSRRDDRAPTQRPRDSAQAVAIAALVLTYLQRPFEGSELSALPKELRNLAPELKKMAKNWIKENSHDDETQRSL